MCLERRQLQTTLSCRSTQGSERRIQSSLPFERIGSWRPCRLLDAVSRLGTQTQFSQHFYVVDESNSMRSFSSTSISTNSISTTNRYYLFLTCLHVETIVFSYTSHLVYTSHIGSLRSRRCRVLRAKLPSPLSSCEAWI